MSIPHFNYDYPFSRIRSIRHMRRHQLLSVPANLGWHRFPLRDEVGKLSTISRVLSVFLKPRDE
jgi:hypothetical protein